MRKILFVLSLLLSHLMPSICQNYSSIGLDTLNKYDENAKKTGYWVEFLKKNLRTTNREKKAVFFRYILYEDGEMLTMKLFVKQTFNTFYIQTNGNNPKEKEIVLLDGTYSLFSKKEKVLINEFNFQNGILQSRKEYYENQQLRLDVTYKNNSIIWRSYSSEGDIELIRHWKLENNSWKEMH